MGVKVENRVVQAPQIHFNGSGKQRLLDDLEAAYTAIQAAEDALRRCAPNGRDYYTISPVAVTRAGDEHMARMRALRGVCDELAAIAGAIENGETEAEVTGRY